MPQAMYDVLRQHSIDPSALLPNQIHLFQNADDEQRMRLIELWRIAPPSYPLEEHLNGTWISTTLEREEALARVRFEQQMVGSQRYREEHMLDTHRPAATAAAAHRGPSDARTPQSDQGSGRARLAASGEDEGGVHCGEFEAGEQIR